MPSLENILFASGLLLLLSALTSKASDRFGVPALLFFLILGMLAGSEGIGGIYFDNFFAAKSLGVVALLFILFSGGFDTSIKDIRHIIVPGIILSTLGVILTAVFVAIAAVYLLNFPWLHALLLGAIVSSTDAAAVFNVLRSKNSGLRGKLQPLIEFESGSNDPIAVFLTVTLINLIKYSPRSIFDFLPTFILDMGLGLLVGWLFGRGIIIIINRVKLSYDGLYHALLFSLIFLTYSTAHAIGGNGFLAVYLAGIISGNATLIHKKTLRSFLEGFAWIMQIIMFLTLGLLVFPSQIIPIIWTGLLISMVLMFIARPLSVWICLSFSKFRPHEKNMISWVGLRGAVPIILATFPLLADVPNANMIFNMVFFIVLSSILLQGTSVPLVAHWLKVDAPAKKKNDHPIELTDHKLINAHLQDVIVPFGSVLDKKSIIDIGLPEDTLIVLICRDEEFFIPKGSTIIQEGDVLWVLADKGHLRKLHRLLGLGPSK